jgi:transposase
VEQAHSKRDWSAVRRIAVEETSARRGRSYVTNVLDAQNSRLRLMVEGRGVQALGAFAEALRLHGGQPSQIEAIAMDMSTSYMKGTRQYFPQATIVSHCAATIQGLRNSAFVLRRYYCKSHSL